MNTTTALAQQGVLPQQQPHAAGSDDLPAYIPVSRHERFALYTSIASRAHSIEICGPENRGVFAGLFERFPQTQEEVEWTWYRHQKISVELLRASITES